MPCTGSALTSHTCLFSWFDIRLSGALDLVLVLHSVITPRSMEDIWHSQVHTWVGCIQGKDLSHCSVSPACNTF